MQEAAERLAREGVVQPVLIGPKAAIPGVKFVDPATSGNVRKYAGLLYERRRSRGMTQIEAEQMAGKPLYFAALIRWRRIPEWIWFHRALVLAGPLSVVLGFRSGAFPTIPSSCISRRTRLALTA